MVDISKDELRSMKIQLAKLQLESKLRSNLTTELDKQKQRARIAEDIAKSKSEQIEKNGEKTSRKSNNPKPPAREGAADSPEPDIAIQSRKVSRALVFFFFDFTDVFLMFCFYQPNGKHR